MSKSGKVVEVIDEQIGTEKNTSTLNVQFNILKESIELAIKYYKNDFSFLTNQAQSDESVSFSRFGINYSQFLYRYTKLVVDASAQYQLMRMTLGFLQWDLYRDQNNNLYAPIIMTINHELSNSPKDLDVSDQEYLKKVRNMKRTYEQQKDKIPDVAKQSSSQEEYVEAPMKERVPYKVLTNSVGRGRHVELQCKPGAHVVSIFGRSRENYYGRGSSIVPIASLGLYCSDKSEVGPAGSDRRGEIFSPRDIMKGFYELAYRQDTHKTLEGLTLSSRDSSIGIGSTSYGQKVECKSKGHVITGIGLKANSLVNTVTYIKCDNKRH